MAFKQQNTHDRPVSVLSIAGSDSGGGAGIQADLKTFAAHGLHGVSAIAALTAQNTLGVSAVHAPPPAFLEAQLAALFEDFRIESTKIGMLASAPLIAVVRSALDQHDAARVVLDPVMIASSGASLLQAEAIECLRYALLPRADVLTPNLPEAEVLLGHAIRDRNDMPEAARALLALGPRAVLLKGGHLPDGEVLDLYLDAKQSIGYVHRRLEREGHGTGCTLASAIAAHLARGEPTAEACRLACDYVHGALLHAQRPGRGPLHVLDHLWRLHSRN